MRVLLLSVGSEMRRAGKGLACLWSGSDNPAIALARHAAHEGS